MYEINYYRVECKLKKPKPPILSDKHDVAMIDKYRESVVQYNLDIEQYALDYREYHKLCAEKDKQFKEDLLREFDLIAHPKADAIYDYVCSKRCTKQEIYYEFEEILNYKLFWD